jgi:AcrR family transcriptional regulator
MSIQPIETMRKIPRQARARQTIATIFEATAQLLRQAGEAGLTTNRVAERAGVSIGTLYQYFPSMDAVLLAMITAERERVIARQQALIDAAIREDTAPREVIRLFIRSLIESFGMAQHLHRPLLKRAWRLDHMPQVMEATQQMALRIREGMAARAHPDYPPPGDAALFAATRAVLGAIRAAVHEDSALLGTAEFEDALVALSDALLRQDYPAPHSTVTDFAKFRG